MHKILTLIALLAPIAAFGQTSNGTINSPIYATGYISQGGGTNVTTTIPAQSNHPTNLNIYTTSAISGTWTIKLPNPAFEGQVLSFNCGAAVSAISIISSDGSSLGTPMPSTCSTNSGFILQFDQRSNIWRIIGSGNTANIDANNVTYTNPNTGGVSRTATSKFSDQVSILDFGAIGDGNITNALANTTALTNALATGKCAFIPYTSAGYHFGTYGVTIPTSACVIGENKVKIKYTGTVSPFQITAYTLTGAPAVIENLTIDMAGASAGSSAIRNMTSLGNVGAVKIRKIVCLNAYSCIDDDNSAASPPAYVTDEEWDDIEAFLTKGRQFTSNHSRGFMYFRNIRIDETVAGQTAPITWSGGYFTDFIGLEFGRFDRVGNGGSLVYQSTNKCIEIEGLTTNGSLNIPGYASVWVLDRLLCDGTSGDGPSFKNVAYLQATAIESFNALGNAVTFYNVTDANVTNMMIIGALGVPGAAVGANGFACTFCLRVNIANMISNVNTGSGAVLTNMTYSTIGNHISNGNTAWAAALFGITGNTQILGGAWSSNGGTLTDSSSGGGNRVTNIIGYNPVGTASITVGASPYTYTAGTSPETVYMYGGTVSDVTQGGVTLATTSPAQFQLGPNESIVVTYTAAPTMKKSIH
jgi:hypothetical protein